MELLFSSYVETGLLGLRYQALGGLITHDYGSGEVTEDRTPH